MTESVVLQPNWFAAFSEFLAPREHTLVLEAALSSPERYQPTGVLRYDGRGGVDRNYRRSFVRFDLPVVQMLFEERLRASFPTICERLRCDPFAISKIEIQITSSGHGDFFKPHNDNSNNTLRGRQITYVYYFHREPKRFDGGELRIFDSVHDGERWRAQPGFRDILPAQNTLVVFKSELLHELRPVSCPSQAFKDSRFTVNGWFHRQSIIS